MTKQRYENINDKSKQNVCLNLIKEARDTRQMRALAAYYLLKRTFQNSTLFNYRSRKTELAYTIGISARSLHAYIGQWKAWGLASDHKHNLTLHSTKDVKKAHRERYKAQITRGHGDTIQDIEARLYGKLLENHNRRIYFNHSLEKKAKETRRAWNGDVNIRHYDENRPGTPAFSLSIRNTAKELSVSNAKATKIIQTLNRLRVMQTAGNPPKAVGHGLGVYRACRDGRLGYFFMAGDTVFRRFGNRHYFLEYPPKEQKITYKKLIQQLYHGGPETKARLEAIMKPNETT